MNKISIVTPTFNEEQNIRLLYKRIVQSIENIKNYDFEIIFIDNASTDTSVNIIKQIINIDPRVKLIVNVRNFGHIRSPYWGILQATGDAIIYLASDLQDPPELIPEFIDNWERGWKVVFAVKPQSNTNYLFHCLRKLYYKILDRITDFKVIHNATGFGLYDRLVIRKVAEINDPAPFLRGLIAELGYPVKEIDFIQPKRIGGITKNNLYTLYDFAILGLISHSNLPLRISSFIGYTVAFVSIFLAFVYAVVKITHFYEFPAGMAPFIISTFLLFGLLFIMIGIIGEYIYLLHRKISNRPIVVEKERINFNPDNNET